MAEPSNHRLVEVDLDENSLPPANSDVQQERRVAIFDLLEGNVFEVEGVDRGPYVLKLAILDNQLVLDVMDASRAPVRAFVLSMTQLDRLIKDYFIICESYYEAIRRSTAQQIEAIDMGRRGLHNEGSELLGRRLAGKVKVDFDTSRRLFTLICALRART
jgi:uncharacterized protein (UPF0262 family)